MLRDLIASLITDPTMLHTLFISALQAVGKEPSAGKGSEGRVEEGSNVEGRKEGRKKLKEEN